MKGSAAHGKSEAERVVICGECRGEFCGSCWKTNLLKRLVCQSWWSELASVELPFTETFLIKKRYSNGHSTWSYKPGCQKGRLTCQIGRMVNYYRLYANFLTFGMSNRIKFAC